MEMTNTVDFACRDGLTDLLKIGAQELITIAVEPLECARERAHSKGSFQGRHTCDVPLGPGATLCLPNKGVGSGLAMALFQRGFQWSNCSRPQSSSVLCHSGIFGEYGFSTSALLGHGKL